MDAMQMYGLANLLNSGEGLGFDAGHEEPDWKRQRVDAPQESMPRHGLVKVKVCTFFQEGRCQKGNKCTFAHGEHEIGQPYELDKSQMGGQMGGAQSSSATISAQMAELQQLSQMLAPEDPLAVELKELMQQAAATEQAMQPSFRKTKLCTFNEAGFCPRGASCTFAHGEAELGQPQPEGSARPGIAQQPKASGPPTMKTKLCIHWQSGSCSRGEACWFAHGEQDLGAPIAQQPGKGGAGGGSVGGPPTPGSAIKTKVCTHYEGGFCSRGDNCWFAHGEHELGMPIVHNTAAVQLKKVKLCVNFEAGFCTYGERCTFAHGEEQLGQAQPNVGQQAPAPLGMGKGMMNKGMMMMQQQQQQQPQAAAFSFKGAGKGDSAGKNKGDKAGPGCTAYVYFCPKDWDEETLKRHFMHCGTIQSAMVVRGPTGNATGAGSVSFYAPKAVMKAIFAMNNFVAAPKSYLSVICKKGEEEFVPPQPDIPGLDFPKPGNPVTGPTGAAPQQGCTIFVKYIPPEWSEVDVYMAFNHYGQIASVSDPVGKGMSIVSFVEPLSAMRAIKGMNGFNAGNRCFLEVCAKKGDEHLFADVMELLRDIPDHVHSARGNPTKVPPGANLYVAGFPPEWTEEDMHREFQGFGQIVCLRVQRHPDGTAAKYGFVGFKEPEMAEAAMLQLNGLQYDGGTLIVNVKEMNLVKGDKGFGK